MKNEKFCFSKQTGLIVLVGVVLVGLVLVMANLANQQTSTSTRAYGTCPNTSFGVGSIGPFSNQTVCPSHWTARDASGNVMKDSRGNTCCYLATNYNGQCPSGSSPDTLGLCLANRIVPGSYVTRTGDNKQFPCCNWIGTVQSSPTPTPPGSNQPPRVNPTSIPPVVTAAPVAGSSACKIAGLFDVEKNINGTDQAFVVDYKRKCRDNVRGLWNGMSGLGSAKCYTRSAVCANSRNCTSESCLSSYNGETGCVFEEVPMTRCPSITTSQNKIYTLDDLSCMPSKKLYVTDGVKNYLQGAKVCTAATGVNYCCNSEITAAEATVLRTNRVNILNCASSPTFAWGPSLSYLNVITWKVDYLKTCFQTNASDGAGCTANRPVGREYCQCKIDNGGNASSETCIAAAKLHL